MFNNKTLLITGGTGTFGNAVLTRFLDTDISEIRIFSRDEKKQDDMRLAYNSPKLQVLYRRRARRRQLAAAIDGVDYVFHAAALKQVPSCEFYPLEAVRTNVLGRRERAERGDRSAASRRVIVLSTDKAVYPINAMGISKAMMEKLMVAKARLAKPGGTILCGTRYGNVMASRGSVIPLFIKQIKDGTAADRHRPGHDPLHDVDRRCRRSGAVRLRARQAGRHLRPEGAGRDDRDAGAGDQAAVQRDQSDRGDRHAPRRKALRDAADARGDAHEREDMGNYFRVPADNRDLNYNAYFTEGQETLSQRGGLPLPQHAPARRRRHGRDAADARSGSGGAG